MLHVSHPQLTDDAQHTYMVALSVSGEVDLERFAQLLAMHGHHVWLRTGRLECCFGHVALRHTFVLAGESERKPRNFPGAYRTREQQRCFGGQ